MSFVRSVGNKRYVCPKHGDQGRMIGVEVHLYGVEGEPLPASLKPRAHRRYCMACWIDMMDEFMEPLAEVETAEG